LPDHLEHVARYAVARGLEISRSGEDATLYTLRARPHWTVEVTMSDTVLEWFISMKDSRTGKEMHADHCEHYKSRDESEAELQQEMSSAVVDFIKATHLQEIRVKVSKGVKLFGRSFFKRKVLQVHVAAPDSWIDVWELK
jgi:hypothetical protein